MPIRNKRSIALLLAAAMVGIGLLTGCSAKEAAQLPASEEEVWGTAPEETQGIALENSLKTFYYPQEWEGKVETVQSEEAGKTTVAFRTTVADREVELFALIMSEGEAEGFLLGSLEVDGKQIQVYSAMNEVDPAQWGEEAYNEICAMQERVNDLIMQLHEDERFTPSR